MEVPGAVHPDGMTQTSRDVVLGFAFLLAFPLAIHLTDWASSEPGDPGSPPAVAGDAARR